MDIQTKKLHFVQEFLRIKDEKLVDKLNAVLKTERKKKFDKELSASKQKQSVAPKED